MCVGMFIAGGASLVVRRRCPVDRMMLMIDVVIIVNVVVMHIRSNKISDVNVDMIAGRQR